jgi:hypothetical protein
MVECIQGNGFLLFISIKKALTKKEIKKKNKVFHFLKQESQINGNGN